MSENVFTLTINPSKINFAPETVLEEILQNVYTIVTTTKFSVPLFRNFGVSATYIDNTDRVARTKLVIEIMENVELFESRVIVQEVNFVSNEIEGELKPVVTIRIKEGVKLT